MSINENGIKNFTYVQMSFNLVFMALTELRFLSKERTVKEVEFIMNSPIFQRYAVALQYMFIMEYIKLLEHESKRYPSNHFASLEKLSIEVLKNQGATFQPSHNLNLKEILEIKDTALFKKFNDKRDKKFGHADSSYKDNPMSINGLSDEEINSAFEHVSLLKKINDRCTQPYGYEFFFEHTDTRTDNFIKIQTNCSNYYFANYLDAVQKGYH